MNHESDSLGSLGEHAREVIPEESYFYAFKLPMLLMQIRDNPAGLATDEALRRDLQECYLDARGKLLVEQTMRAHHVFPPDGWAAIFAPKAVPRRQKSPVERVAKEETIMQQVPSALDLLKSYWSPRITGALRTGIDPQEWYLVLDDTREIYLGTTADIQSQQVLRGRIFEATSKIPRRIPTSRSEEYDACLEALADIAQWRNEPERHPIQQAIAMIRGYLETLSYRFEEDFDDEEWPAVARRNYPFRRDGHLYLHVRQWHSQYMHYHAPEITYAHCLRMLRTLGARNRIVTIHGERTTSRSYWMMPIEILLVQASESA